VTSLLILVLQGGLPGVVGAVDTSQNPQSGSVGLEGSISTAPPSKAGTIATPRDGAVFTSIPITVAGLCTTGNLVKIFDNNVFVGSTLCVSNSYSLKIDLFSGGNQLVARVYDALDQAGPDSNSVNVTFNDAQFAQFASRVSLTSIYARRGAFPGDELTWPLALSGGTGPYAVSVDWGDGSAPALQSQSVAGSFDAKHTYSNAGVYTVTVRATDKNGVAAFLQLVAVANGATQHDSTGSAAKKGNTTTGGAAKVLWLPTAFTVGLLPVIFWLGRRHELYVLRKSLDQARKQ
jgi:hypothetical protein